LIAALPAARRAARPPELRGLRRDQVRLVVVDRERQTVTHARFDEIGRFLERDDLLVLNSSRTLPAAVPARRSDGSTVQLRPCVRRPGAWDALAVQPEAPFANVSLTPSEVLSLGPRLRARVDGRRPDIPLLWQLRLDGPDLETILARGEPIRYSYVPDPIPLEHYQNVYAGRPGSAESPSAGRAFTWQLLLALRQAGIGIAETLLHTGLSSFQDDAFDAEHHLFEEWFEVGPDAVSAVGRARRVMAVGTTAVRGLETAAQGGRLRPASGWTSLVITPTSRLRVVDGLLTGLHEPQASHFDLLRAFLPAPLLERAYAEAVDRGYLWHEFGDAMLII